MSWIDKLPLTMVIIFTVVLSLAPFFPEPHLLKKLKMLVAGTLKRPLDIFDLLLHISPLVLLIIKLIRMWS